MKYEAQDKDLKGYLIAKKDKVIEDREFLFDSNAYGDIFKENGIDITAIKAKERSEILYKWMSGNENLSSTEKDVIKLLADVIDGEGELLKFKDIEDKKHLNNIKLLAYHLGQGKTEGKIEYKGNYVDVLKVGANTIDNNGLNFSNFGVWEGIWDFDSVKNTLLKTALEDKYGTVSFDSSFFYSGVEKLRSSVVANNEKEMKFSGKTLAVIEKDDGSKMKKRLTGSANIVIPKNQTIGSLTLDFKDWYKFSVNGLEFGNPNGKFETNDTDKWSIDDTNAIDDKFKLVDKNINFANIEGSMYGAENEKATESVGLYSLKIDDKFDLKGAFGMKKEK